MWYINQYHNKSTSTIQEAITIVSTELSSTYVNPRSWRYWPTKRITSTSLLEIFGGRPDELCPLVDDPLRAEAAPSPCATFFELPFVACCILPSLVFFRGGGEKPPSLDSPLEARMATSARDNSGPWIQPWKSPTLSHLRWQRPSTPLPWRKLLLLLLS